MSSYISPINIGVFVVIIIGIIVTSNPLFILGLWFLHQDAPESPDNAEYAEEEPAANPIGFIWDEEEMILGEEEWEEDCDKK